MNLNESRVAPKETTSSRLLLENDVRQIPRLAAFVESAAEAAALDASATMGVTLALEEAVTNIMMYAYSEGVKGDIVVESSISGGNLTFVVSDSGKPFDPTAAAEADITLGVEERNIGGLGIHLVRKLMDGVVYKRAGGKNILTLTKKI